MSPELASGGRHAWSVALLVALPVFAVAALSARALGPLEHTLLPDDAFYYLCIGRNLAGGFGPTFDGVHPTSGFQPLWQALVAIVALGPFDDASLLTATVALNLTCLAAAAALLAVTLGRRGLGPVLWTVAVLLALANPYLLKTSLNGMESGLVWLSWSFAIIVLTRLMEGWRGTMAAVAAGAVAGFVLLSRLDGLGLALVLAWVVATGAAQGRFRATLVFVAALAVVIGPYVAWMLIRFGHWLPVSVFIKSRTAQTGDVVLGLVAMLVVAGVMLVASRRLSAAMRAATLVLLTGLLPLVGYAIVSPVRLSHLWYYPGALAAGLTLATLVGSEWWAHGRRKLVVTGIALGVTFAAAAWGVRLSVTQRGEHYRVADAMGRRLERTLAPDVRIAGWNIGLVAYRRSCRVTNLDGLVNSYDYLDAFLGRRVVPWLDREGISGIVEPFDGDPLATLAERDPRLPSRVSERFRMEYDHVSAMALPTLATLTPAPRRQVFIYFDYRVPAGR
jgi:hypothetical protein